MSDLADQIRTADTAGCNEIMTDLIDTYGKNRANIMWSDATAEIETDDRENWTLIATADTALARLRLVGAL